EHDQETGLIYAKARYYDPETARFLSQDPWSGDVSMPPSLHKYLYAYQNPTVYVDPDGHCPRLAADSSYCYLKELERVAIDHRIDMDSVSGMREATWRQAAEDRRLADQTRTGLAVMAAPAAVLGSVKAATSLYFRNPEALALLGGEAGLFVGAMLSGADTPLSMPASAGRRALQSGMQQGQAAMEVARNRSAGRSLAEVSDVPLAPSGATGRVTEAAGAPGSVTKGRDEVVDVYRVFGGDARAQGFSWTTTDPRTVTDFRDAAGLPSGGASGSTNTADFLIKGKANSADIIKSRSALPLDGNEGGLIELIIDPRNVDIVDFSVLNP
ncbi:RHS repeat-associated core domain-containing protein, partial [Alcanivorax sp. JB21]|uniref:RHS repeat-associated core domain-containing protein n=1 Tax=Alcanivorax limicola TaxID=2874102 RepID=UPI001CC05385